MKMNYEELDGRTRGLMLLEFEAEISGEAPYLSKALSEQGLARFPALMRDAIRSGNERSLAESLDDTNLWEPEEFYTQGGVTRSRRRNIRQAAMRLALTEFSTWYVRGFAKRLLGEEIRECQVCRGQEPKWEPGECTEHEGRVAMVQVIYDHHRARYWPEPGDPTAFAIPFGPGCHHIIRRLS